MFSPKTIVRILFNTALGVVLIIIWLHFVNLGQIFAKLSKIHPAILFFVLGSLILGVIFRAFRLKLFLQPVTKISFWDLFFLNGTAMMVNFLIPIRGGDIAKGLYLGHKYQLPMGKSVVWIFLDRMLDFVGAVVITSILLYLVPTNLPVSFALICLVLSILMLLMIFLVSFQPGLTQKLVRLISLLLVVDFLKKYFFKLADFLLDSFKIFKREGGEIIWLSLLTALGYLADGLVWYFIFISLGSNQPFLKMYLGQAVSALAYIIPAAPGYVGSAEASGLLILSGILGIDPNLASAMIVLFHLVSAVFVISIGIFSIYFLKLDLGELFRKILKK